MKKKLKDCDTFHKDPRNALEKYFESIIPDIVKVYGLGNISFYYMTPQITQDEVPVKDGMLMIRYDEIYRTAFITITPNAVYLFNKGEMEPLHSGLVHEVGHIITNKLSELALSRHATKKQIRDSVEETTETIAIMARNLLKKESKQRRIKNK